MAIGHAIGPLIRLIKKYKYVVFIVVIGILLMTIPPISELSNEKVERTDAVLHTQPTDEERLESILSQINGAGNVSVMLTTATGEEIIYQVDSKNDAHNDIVETDIETVVITDQNRTEGGLIRQVNPPKYLGAIIVCQGADDPKIQLAITDAVSKITGLGANRISVLKMK